MLVRMKMTAMAAELSSQLQDSSFNELGFEDRLWLLVTAEWLIRPLSPQKFYDMLEIVEARYQRSMIFCT